MSTVTEIGTIIRTNSMTVAADVLATYLLTANLADVRSLIAHGFLGTDSRMILDVALASATETAGTRASRCKVGTRTKRAHLAIFGALCEVHDLLMSQEKDAALAA